MHSGSLKRKPDRAASIASALRTVATEQAGVAALEASLRNGMAEPFAHAVELIAEDRFDHMVVWSDRQVKAVPIAEAIGQYQAVDPDDALVHTARGLGISFGD